MRSAVPPAPARFQFRRFAVLATLPILAPALLPTSVAAAPRVLEPSDTTIAALEVRTEVANPPGIELAGNYKRDSDENFDPYGKDDPTNRKWGEAAGLGGNRYGGLNTRGDGKDKKSGKNSDRDDRELRPSRGDEDRRK
jgi:hypothetical protein